MRVRISTTTIFVFLFCQQYICQHIDWFFVTPATVIAREEKQKEVISLSRVSTTTTLPPYYDESDVVTFLDIAVCFRQDLPCRESCLSVSFLPCELLNFKIVLGVCVCSWLVCVCTKCRQYGRRHFQLLQAKCCCVAYKKTGKVTRP